MNGMTSKLARYEVDFPEWGDMRQEEIGIVTVYIEDIVGGTKFRADEYNDDWTIDGENDLRYEKVIDHVKKQVTKQGKEDLDLGWIHLFQFKRDDGENVYYVCGDGHRRVSACKQLGVMSVKASVTMLLPRTVVHVQPHSDRNRIW